MLDPQLTNWLLKHNIQTLDQFLDYKTVVSKECRESGYKKGFGDGVVTQRECLDD